MLAPEPLPWTFFTVNDDGTCHAFGTEQCDRCGCECEAANAVTLHETPDRCKSLGLRERLERLPELGATDAGDAVCPDCQP